jgi:hypothetical protein
MLNINITDAVMYGNDAKQSWRQYDIVNIQSFDEIFALPKMLDAVIMFNFLRKYF